MWEIGPNLTLVLLAFIVATLTAIIFFVYWETR